MSQPRRAPDPDEHDDFEIVDDAPPKRRKKKPRVVQDDDEPLPARVVSVPDDRDDEPVRGPRRKRKKRTAEPPAEEPPANEWVIPLVLMGLGLVLTVVGTIGYARSDPDSGLGAGAAVLFRLLGQVIAIPVTIAALIGIGTVMGIEYGTLASTVRNLAAMGLFIGGLLDVSDWMRLPWFIYQPVMLVIGLGLLMSLFGLDVDEAMATMVGLNLLSFLLKIALFMLVMMLLHKSVNKPRFDGAPDPADPPGWVAPGDDGDDPAPRPKAKGKGGNAKAKGRPPVVPVNPDD